ncbi:cysteine proteinase inhibitor 5 [Citrus sinensis]|uniref:Cysteine proteinase inhibitor 5 n=1 Tax=Citrus sinensis TaxID=2711 RepID=A0ACB8KZN1_CITSI|nr:cysteine proteinase inhibitor 5 [Citrus sinensis]
MNQRLCCLIVLFLSEVPLLAAGDRKGALPMPGGWTPIDPTEKHVMEIGQFAVTEYNKRSKSALKFESVEKAWTQVVSGTNYRLILVVKDGLSTKKFEAVVWEKPWEHFKSLTSFKPMVK